ncbi:MAG: hypothetical protein D6768_09465, partial [Chloroflexi bacterium]
APAAAGEKNAASSKVKRTAARRKFGRKVGKFIPESLHKKERFGKGSMGWQSIYPQRKSSTNGQTTLKYAQNQNIGSFPICVYKDL